MLPLSDNQKKKNRCPYYNRICISIKSIYIYFLNDLETYARLNFDLDTPTFSEKSSIRDFHSKII